MSQKSLNDWLSLLASRHPTDIQLGLERVGRVAQQLGFLVSGTMFSDKAVKLDSSTPNIGLPQRIPAKKVVTVAGTNGKGSCVAALESILLAAGYRVGAYTSPHFIHYNERIRINRQMASDQALCSAFDQIEIARGDTSLSYFEFGTLAALLIMAESDLDVAILEIGLGGRLDAVNIVSPDIAIVTSIALDHQDWLGDDIQQIAREKAAIGRPGKPLVYGDENPIQGLLDTADEIGARLLLNGRDFTLNQFGCAGESHLPPASVACAVEAARLLNSELSSDVIERGLSEVRLDGRFQQLVVHGVNLILDVAHNPQAVELLARRLSSLPTKVIAVAGMMADKDILSMLTAMESCVMRWHFCDIPGQDRAAKASNLASVLYNVTGNPKGLGEGVAETGSVNKYTSPVAALEAALDSSEAGDTVVVFGSFFTVGPTLHWLREQGIC